MESGWEEYADEFSDIEELGDAWEGFDREYDLLKAGKEDEVLENVGGNHLGLMKWKRSHGLAVYGVLDHWKDDACRMDHVKEEHMMTFTLPMAGAYPQDQPFDRNLMPPYHWIPTDELQTLRQLLETSSDFLRLQVLCCLKEWASTTHLKKFTSEPNMVSTVASVMLESSNCGVMRMAACVISLMVRNHKLRRQFFDQRGSHFLDEFLKLVNGETEIKDEGCRWLITKALAEMTTNDLAFAGHLICNYSLDSLFTALATSTNTLFKINLLNLLNNLLLHPLGLEAITSRDDFSFGPILQALTSLVPKYHRAGFQLLDLILSTSRQPLQSQLHAKFVAQGGLSTTLALLEEVFDLDRKVAINCLVLLDHLADGEVGQRALITVALNLLRSIIYFKNARLPKHSLRSLLRKKEGSILNTLGSLKSSLKMAKKTKTISDSLSRTVAESKAIDEYNGPDSKAFFSAFMPIDYSFTEEENASSVSVPAAMKPATPRKEATRPSTSQSLVAKSSIMSFARGSVRGTARLLERRTKKRVCAGERGLLDLAVMSLDRTEGIIDYPSRVDNNVRCLSIEVISKLAAHPLGVKLLIGLVRNLCPLLRRHTKDTGIAESVGYCLEVMFRDNYRELLPLLSHYYLTRELAGCLNADMADRAKASLVAAIAVLLNQSPRMVYTMTAFSIRKPVLHLLRLAPDFSPDYITLYALMLVHSISRYYKRRDFLMSKTLVRCLVNILQNDATEEQCRIYTACALAFFTFANRRYRKLGSDAFSVEKENILKRYSVDEAVKVFIDEDSDDEAPGSTVDSLKQAIVEEGFFQQACEKTFESPANFFYMFLLHLLLKRATPIWGNVVYANFKLMINWVRKCIIEKRSMSVYFYKTLMESIPSLSFYFHNEVGVHSKIDQDPFYVCIDPDQHQSFTDFLLLESEVCPKYTVYKLDKGEVPRAFPWDQYWKERGQATDSSPLIAQSMKSVLLDSIFGFGSFYSDDSNPSLIMNTVVSGKHRGPFFGPRSVVDFDKEELAETDTFSKFTPFPCPLVSKVRQKNDPFTNKLLTNRQRYITNLTGITFALMKEDQLDKPKDYIIPRSFEKRTREMIFAAINEFYKNPVKNFSMYQFKMLTESLTSPPRVWLEAINETKEPTSTKLASLKRAQKCFPNSLLGGFSHPVFYKSRSKNTLQIEFEVNDIYKEANVLVTSSILSAFEKLSGKKFSFISNVRPDEGLVEEMPKSFLNKCLHDRSLKLKYLMSRYMSLLKKTYVFTNEFGEWSFNLAAYGKAFFEFFNKPLTDAIAKAVIKYSLEEIEIPPTNRRRSSITIKSKTSPRFQESSQKEYSSTRADGGRRRPESMRRETLPENEQASSRLREVSANGDVDSNKKSKRNIQRSNKNYYGSGHSVAPRETLRDKTKSKVSIEEVYIPTKREILIDFFSQPGSPELRRPHSRSFCYSKANSKTFVGTMTEPLFRALLDRVYNKSYNIPEEWSDFKEMFNTPIYRKVCNSIIQEHMKRIANIDYDSATRRTELDIANIQTTFQTFCENVNNEIKDILKREYRRPCWYRDIIKIIARNVCRRLEGPFGYVSDYLMLQHRNQLKWRLGTTVIPMGLLRIGGQFERAILFKFFADQMMIPCRLRRSSLTDAWVEVPLHPFQDSTQLTFCLVDLDKSPGKLAEIIKETNGNNAAVKERTKPKDDLLEDDIDDQILSYLEKKRNLNIFPKKPINVRDPSLVSEDTPQTLQEGETEEVMSVCSYPLDSPVDESPAIMLPDPQQREESEKSDLTRGSTEKGISWKTGSDVEDLRRYCWRSDPFGVYTTIIGRVPDAAVTGGSKAAYVTYVVAEVGNESCEPSVRTPPSEHLSPDTSPSKASPIPSAQADHIDITDLEELFPQWKRVLLDLSDYELSRLHSSTHQIKS